MKTKYKTTHIIGIEELEGILSKALGIEGKSPEFRFKIEEVGGHPLDHYPGIDRVTSVSVSFEQDENPF